MVLPKVADLTIEDVYTRLRDKSLTSVHLVETYLRRIEQVNPIVHAVIEVYSKALEDAKRLDDLLEQGTDLGYLHGVPILVKDNIGTVDVPTTAGSTALQHAKLPRDATVITKLRTAGAIILGKANLSQWSNFRSSADSSSDGWSAAGGQCQGVFYPNQSPGGSSSGSGVAIALGLCVASVATDTMGSIGNPAQANAVVGISPTVGLVSRDMMMMFSEHQDCIGPMNRTVKDAAILLTTMAGKDPLDPYTSHIPFSHPLSYIQSCNSKSLHGVRIGVPRSSIIATPSNSPSISAFNASLSILRSLGAEIIDGSNFSQYAATTMWTDDAQLAYGQDFRTAVTQYFSQLSFNPHSIDTLADLIAYTKSAPAESYPARDIDRWIAAAAAADLDPNIFVEARARHVFNSADGGITGVLEKYSLDALVLPESVANSIPGPAGLPTVTVPMGVGPADAEFVSGRGGMLVSGPGIPFAISFLGRKWSEEKLIGYAYTYEQATLAGERPLPYLMPDIEL